MFRRRSKAAPGSDADTSRRSERRSKKPKKAVPPVPVPDSALPADAGEQDAGGQDGGDEAPEPWYRQSGPLFDESFRDSPPAAPPPDSEAVVTAFAPPLPVDPAASGVLSSVPTIQRVGQVTDPGPLGEEMRSAFGPAPAAAAGDEPAAGDTTVVDDTDATDADDATTGPLIDFDAADHAPSDDADPGDITSDDVAAGDAEPDDIVFDDPDTADDDGDLPDRTKPDPLIDFDADDTTPHDAAPEDDDASAPNANALEASEPSGASLQSQPTQHGPPMVVPVRGYYIARTEDTLRSVAAQFLNAPERWSELRALNAAYPGIAGLDPDELVPEGAALALPGDPLPWGRPDPVYLWTLAETFLYTAWGREPTPEEVVPFWRGLTQGALPEGEQSPPGIEFPDVAEIAARSGDADDAASPVAPAPAPAVAPAAFEMPAVVESDVEAKSDVESDIEASIETDVSEAVADPAPSPPHESTDDGQVDTADTDTAVHDDQIETADLDTADADAETVDDQVDTADLDTADADAETVVEAHDEPEHEPAPEAVDMPVDVADMPTGEHEAALVDVPDAAPPITDTRESVVDTVVDVPDAAPAATDTTAAPEPVAPEPVVDTAELAGLVRAVEEAIEEGVQTEPEADIGADTGIEPETAAYGDPAAAEPALAPPPTLEGWLDEPSAEPPPLEPPPLDPSAPYAGMPGASAAEAPPLPPEAEAPRVPHFMPSVTSTNPGGLAAPTQTSAVGRTLAGTAVGDAMLLWQLSRRRRQGQHGTEAHDSIELSLQQSAGGEALELIEAAMRHLRAVTVGQQRPKPSVLAVRSGTYGFEVLLDSPVPTPPGWRSASGGYVLELPQGVTARDLGAVGQGPSLCPALAPVGTTFEGPLLLNLEQLGCLAVSGPSAPATSLLGAIVGTLGSSPMAGHLRITAVGLENAAAMIGWEAVSFASYDSLELENLLANAYGPSDGMIDLLVIGTGNDLLIQRAAQIATAPESRFCLVGATSAVSARWPWRIHVDDTGTAVVHPISITMTAARAVQAETLAPFGGGPPGGIDPAGLR